MIVCRSCGFTNRLPRAGEALLSELRESNRDQPGRTRDEADPAPGFRRAAMTTSTKVRLRFAKQGDLRLVSHHDLLRCLERMLRRAQIPMASSQGFNPRPKITFALALG